MEQDKGKENFSYVPTLSEPELCKHLNTTAAPSETHFPS